MAGPESFGSRDQPVGDCTQPWSVAGAHDAALDLWSAGSIADSGDIWVVPYPGRFAKADFRRATVFAEHSDATARYQSHRRHRVSKLSISFDRSRTGGGHFPSPVAETKPHRQADRCSRRRRGTCPHRRRRCASGICAGFLCGRIPGSAWWRIGLTDDWRGAWTWRRKHCARFCGRRHRGPRSNRRGCLCGDTGRIRPRRGDLFCARIPAGRAISRNGCGADRSPLRIIRFRRSAADLTIVFRYVFSLAVVAALLPIGVPWLAFVFTIAMRKGLGALGGAMLLRGGLISIGHALYFAIGAYAVAFLMRETGIADLLLLLVCATLITTVAGLVVGAFMVRYRAIFFAMLNLAISMVFFTLLSKLYYFTGGTDGLRVATPTILTIQLSRSTFDIILQMSVLILMIASALLIDRYLKSPLGEALRAIDSNEVRLEYLGVSARGAIWAAYTVSAGLAGLGGAISAVAIGHVVPEMSYWTVSGQLVLIAVLGGIGGVQGALIGAFFLELEETFAVGLAAEAWNAIIGLSLLIVIFFLPEGLYGLIQRLERLRASPK